MATVAHIRTILDRYVEKPSFMHLLDPRTKLIWVACVYLVALIFTHPIYLFALFLSALVVGAGILRYKIRLLISLWLPFIVLTPLLWSLAIGRGPTPLFSLSWGFISIYISLEAVLFGMGMMFRMLSMITATLILICTTRFSEICLGIHKFGFPYVFSFFVSATVRQMQSFTEDIGTIMDAQRSRACELEKGGFVSRIEKYILVLYPLIGISLTRIQDLTIALETKAFGVSKKRETFKELKMSPLDAVAIALCTMITGILIYLRLNGHGIMIIE